MQEDIIKALAEKVAEALQSRLGDAVSSPKEENRFYTVEEVCKMLRISKATYYRHLNLGYIEPAQHVGRKPLFNQQSIDNYLNNFS